MFNRFSTQKQSFASTLVLLLTIDIVLSFAYGTLPSGLTAARSFVDLVQFIAMTITMAFVLKTIIEDF